MRRRTYSGYNTQPRKTYSRYNTRPRRRQVKFAMIFNPGTGAPTGYSNAKWFGSATSPASYERRKYYFLKDLMRQSKKPGPRLP